MRILLVDDDEPLVELMTKMLEPISSLIDHTDNLNEAVRMADENHYNICCLDLRLRNTGKEEAFRIIEHLKSAGTSVIVVSGIPEVHLKEEALAAGATAFVAKDGGSLSHALLMAANIAILKMPRGSFKSSSYSEHVEMLRKMVEAA